MEQLISGGLGPMSPSLVVIVLGWGIMRLLRPISAAAAIRIVRHGDPRVDAAVAALAIARVLSNAPEPITPPAGRLDIDLTDGARVRSVAERRRSGRPSIE